MEQMEFIKREERMMDEHESHNGHGVDGGGAQWYCTRIIVY